MKTGTDSRRNIVLILCDQLRPDFLHAYGADFIPTPNIDALAANGVTFDNSITASTVCALARASIMTGQFVSQHGAWTNDIPCNAGTAKTNVNIEFSFLGDDKVALLNAKFASGTAGDALASTNTLNNAQIAQFGSAGMLLQIEKYVNDPELMPNYQKNAIAYSNDLMGCMTSPDGHIYALANYDSFPPTYLESAMLMNTAWLAKAGMEVPTTSDELHEVLTYFRDNDMNGNGNINDEVPMFINAEDGGYASLPAMMCMWGISTKNSTLDTYILVNNNVCEFAPMTQNFKDAIRTLASGTARVWYGAKRLSTPVRLLSPSCTIPSLWSVCTPTTHCPETPGAISTSSSYRLPATAIHLAFTSIPV